MNDEVETPRRGPGRPPKVRDPEAKDATVTYHPLEPGDPATVEWDKLTFEANVPRPVSAQTHADLIEMAKTNAWFAVEGFPRAKRIKPTREPILRVTDEPMVDERNWVESA